MALLDDELVPEERRELELHLLECASCKHHVETERAELQMIRKALVAPPAPDLFRARLANALDAADRTHEREQRQQRRSVVGRLLLPGAAMMAAAAAIVTVIAVRPSTPAKTGVVAKEVVRQQARTMPLEVRGASTGTWLRENFAPIEPPRFRAPRHDIVLLGARLTAVAGHNAAQLRYRVIAGDSQFTLTAVVIDELAGDELSGGTAIRVGDRTLHVHDANGIPAVTYVDELRMGYAFASDRLSAQELLELVVSSDLIGRAQQGR